MSNQSRINKFIALCGVCSRRAAEKLVAEGKITLNGRLLTGDDLSTIVTHDTDIVTLNGQRLTPATEKRYILLNKPRLCVTTVTDPHNRTTVIEILRRKSHSSPPLTTRIYPIGRLDFDTEGVLLLTDDGDLTHRLAHPRYEVKKVYQALIDGIFTPADGALIAEGVELEDGHIGKAQAKLLRKDGSGSIVELSLHEGHKHEVKQLLAGCGYQTLSLSRVEFAGITCDGLKPAEWRDLTVAEVKSLRKLVL
ncbi:rRNA pseudouridine synthase [bacterium AH-315-J21]|nr:rRNA pseudouridine synthase [bacterium AH-315-J21]